MAGRNDVEMTEQSIALPRKSVLTVSSAWWAIWSHRWFVLAAVLTLGVGGWQSARLIWGPAVVVDQVRRGNLVETVVASGHVETPFRVEIGSQITGTVDDVLVQEGERVSKGQHLISLEARELKAAVVQAQGAVAQAEARMRQLDELTLPSAREALTQAQANLLNAQQTFDRTSQLAKDGYATRAALDDAQKTLDVARTQVRTAEFQVYTASPNGSDYVMAQTQLNQAHANLETAESRLGYATIAAPRDGILITRSVERGTVVQPGKALLVLAPAGEVQLVLQIDERNLGKIALGQKALASADAYPDQRFRRRGLLHQSRDRYHPRFGRGKTHGGRSARLSAAGHDCFCRYRGRCERSRARAADPVRARRALRPALGARHQGRPRCQAAGSTRLAGQYRTSKFWTGSPKARLSFP